jgi:hypothetical protein
MRAESKFFASDVKFASSRIEAIYSIETVFDRFFPGVDSRIKFLR